MSYWTDFRRWLVRGGTAANLASVNEVPLAREIIAQTDASGYRGNRPLKLGDGTTNYNSLPGLYTIPEAPAFRYAIDTGSTADSDPGAGLLKFNNATQASATALYLDDLTDDTGTDLSAFLLELAGSNDSVLLTVCSESGTFRVFKITAIVDGTGYFKLTVANLCGSGSFTDAERVQLQFMPQGKTAGGSGDFTFVWKTSNQTRNSTTTLADDSALTVALAASSVYRIEVKFMYSIANATMDFKFQPNYTGTFSDITRVRQTPAGLAGGTDNESILVNTGYMNVSHSVGSSAAGYGAIDLDIQLTTTTAGTFSIQWAQNTSDAGNCVVLSGAYIKYKKL